MCNASKKPSFKHGANNSWRDAPLLMQSALLQSGCLLLLSVCISLAIYHRAVLCRGNLRVMLGYYRNTATTILLLLDHWRFCIICCNCLDFFLRQSPTDLATFLFGHLVSIVLGTHRALLYIFSLKMRFSPPRD